MTYYHYQRGARRHDFKKMFGRTFYITMTILTLLMFWDWFFNYGAWTIDTLIYISERLPQ